MKQGKAALVKSWLQYQLSTLKVVLENASEHGTVEYAAVYMPTEDSIDEYTTSFAQIDY